MSKPFIIAMATIRTKTPNPTPKKASKAVIDIKGCEESKRRYFLTIKEISFGLMAVLPDTKNRFSKG